jgi:hypothetical protein
MIINIAVNDVIATSMEIGGFGKPSIMIAIENSHNGIILVNVFFQVLSRDREWFIVVSNMVMN